MKLHPNRCLLLGNLKDMEAVHIEAMVNFLLKPAGRKLCLPRELRLSTEYGRLVLSLAETSLCPLPSLDEEVTLNIPGDTELSGWKVKAEIFQERVEVCNEENNGFTACFDLDKAGTQLLVRRRQRGDRFQPLGMRQFKKLQDFMIDAHIPRSWRDRVPVLCSPQHVLWVVGWRIDERVKVTKSTQKTLKVQFSRSSSCVL
ncbi:tRNA lysidine(34) synthetase TilS [Chloroflexota bacterium]